MEQTKNPLKHIKFEVRRSPLALKILLTVLILCSMAALTALRWVHQEIQAETREVLSEASAIEYRNEVITDRMENVGNIQGIADIAEAELGLVNPGSVMINTD